MLSWPHVFYHIVACPRLKKTLYSKFETPNFELGSNFTINEWGELAASYR